MEIKKSTKIATLSIMIALSVILTTISFPMLPSAPFLRYDAGDVTLFITGFMFGPIHGLLATVIASIIEGVTTGQDGQAIGILMHILTTGSFVVVSASIYKKYRTFKGAIVASIFGFFAWMLMAIVSNIGLTPIHLHIVSGYKLPIDQARASIYKMLLPTLIPFNLIKTSINIPLTFILYKQISKITKIENLLNKSKNIKENNNHNYCNED